MERTGNITTSFKKYLVDSCQCALDDHFLVTVSGGVDSVVLAHLFHTNGLKFSIAHCNFQLRGDESEHEQQLVEALAVKYQVPFHVNRFNTAYQAKNKGISVQMAARELRYSWFEELAEKHGYQHIATGHNKNDVVETLLLNLSRGTGVRGLMGIRAHHEKLVRPLLFASRKEIEQHARDFQLHWSEDSSNQETKYQRNRIRHIIIPEFESLNPAFVETTLHTIELLEQTGKILDYTLTRVKESVWTQLPDRVLIDMEKLTSYPGIEVLLFELLRGFGIQQLDIPALIEAFKSTPGKQFHTRTHSLTRDRSQLIITPREIGSGNWEKHIEENVTNIESPIRLAFRIENNAAGFKIPPDRCIAAIDADKITFPLILRNWKAGDRFYPLGLSGSKKISDFLINQKIPLPDKKRIAIIESQGKIVWVVNHRIDDRFKVNERTLKILLIEYQDS